MIHAHYKGLATKAEGEAWFNVLPPDMKPKRRSKRAVRPQAKKAKADKPSAGLPPDAATNVIPLTPAARKKAH